LRSPPEEGARPLITQSLTLGAGTRATIRPATNRGPGRRRVLDAGRHDAPVVVDGTMQWGGSSYGSHAETSVSAPALAWYFAEGATFFDFDLFYLLQNPGTTASVVEVTYLLPAPAVPLVKSYTVNPAVASQSGCIRRIRAWRRPRSAPPSVCSPAARSSRSARCTAPAQLVVERAMYSDAGAVRWAAGSNALATRLP
jgi:hypothetical protein